MNSTFMQFIIQIVSWAIIYFGFKNFTWYDEYFNELFKLFIPLVLSYLISLFAIFYKPYRIEILQTDILSSSDDPMTVLIEENQIKGLQKQHTINAEITFSRKRSLFWFLLVHSLKKYKVYIQFQLTFPVLSLNTVINDDRSEDNENQGFNFVLNDYIKVLANENSESSIRENFKYYLSYDVNINSLRVGVNYNIYPKVVVVPKSGIKNVFTDVYSRVINFLIKKQVKSFVIKIVEGD